MNRCLVVLGVLPFLLLSACVSQGESDTDVAHVGLRYLPVSAHDCKPPTTYQQEPGDNTDDASGSNQLFERVHAPGLTERNARTAASAWWDVNADRRPDLLTYGNDDGLRLALNRGCFEFSDAPVVIHVAPGAESGIARGGSTLAAADFNDDGLPEVVIGTSRKDRMQFLVSREFGPDGLVFDDLAVQLGVTNNGAYVHGQMSIADVNGDGWLDIAVGSEQIGSEHVLGRPLSRMYIYHPAASGRFSDGKFVDIANSTLMPGFGGVDREECDPARDKSISSLLLRDFDDDGDLDLIAAAQADINPSRTPDGASRCSPGLWQLGVFAYRNLLVEKGAFRFEEIEPGKGEGRNDTDNVLPEVGQMRYDAVAKAYVPTRMGIAAYVVHAADFDNDDDLDVIAVAPTNPALFATPESLAGKHWVNAGNWSFSDRTEAAGLASISWTYSQWAEFFDAEISPSRMMSHFCPASPNFGRCSAVDASNLKIWAADLVSADWDNDGWRDFILLDRSELDGNWGFLRDVYFRNRGDGSFAPMPTTWSGVSENMIAGEVIDVDGDGWLDFYEAARNSGSGQLESLGLTQGERADQNNNRIYWNTSLSRGRVGHWLRVSLEGMPQRQLIGAQIKVYDSRTNRFHARQDYFTVSSYKTAHEPFAHFGLGALASVRVEVKLPTGARVCLHNVEADRAIVIDVTRASACKL